jgi:hypothetical protein
VRRPRLASRILGLTLALAPSVALAQPPDWTAILYPDGVGCGLYVQFLTPDGWEPPGDGQPSAFFPGGAPPSTSAPECVAKCREWAASPSVSRRAADYRKRFFITQVRGTCYLRRQALGAPRVIDTP